MRKVLLLAIAVLFTGITMASSGFSVKYSQNTDSERQLSFTLGEYSIQNVTIDGQTYSKIVFDGQIVSQQKGWAELPFLSSTIQISNNKNVSVDVANSQYVDIALDYPLLPSRGVIYRNQDPTIIPYEIDPASVIDAFYPKAITVADDPFILRDIRGTNIKVNSFRYNAKQNTLRVYTQVNVNINDNNTEVINPKTKVNPIILREMDAMYKSIFVNYGQSNKEDLTIGQYGDILVICTERDEDAIQPFIDWKKEKGFNVTMEVVEVATNVKTNIQDAYDNNPDLLYVQLVGDWADIKCDIGTSQSAPMDPMLGCVEGDDFFPELAIGRFSGNSPAHITIQVNKTITYEKAIETGDEWYSQSLGIGSQDGTNGDDGEIDSIHVQNIYDNKLDPFSYNFQNKVYGTPSNTYPTQVSTAVNNGVSIVNYCGHGSNNSWTTSGFSNSHIAQLTNGDKLPFIFSVACVNGAFHQGECFGEVWLKKEGGGAIMTLMATLNQDWTPPMRGQDYFNDILTGGYDYDNNPGSGTNTEEGRTFIGSIVLNGLILMYAEAGASDLETIQTWTTFGDCSLQPRTIAPAELSLSTDVIISGVDFSTIVTSDGNPVEGAMVGVSQADGGLFYNAITDENGEITIPHELLPGDAKLVVTAMNTQTIYLDIVVISPDGPYMVIDGFEMNTDDGLVVYNSEVSMDVTFKNLGSEVATDVTVTLTSEEDGFCTLLTDITVNIGTVDADETVIIEDAFVWAIADNAPDQYTVNLAFDITGTAKETWQDNISFKINAPALNITFAEVDDSNGGDGNGRLDAGETAILRFNGLNIGHADSPEANMSLNSSSPYITINTSSVDLGVLAIEGIAVAEFEVVVADDAPVGVLANFSSDIVAGNYNHNFTMMLNLGLVVEDFETGDLTQYDWQFEDNADWEIIEGANVYEGVYSAKSMDVNDSQQASLSLDVSVSTESPVSFYLKVSSEATYDRLKFYIDGVEQDDWSGEIAWQMAEFTVSAGDHTLKWTYSKDGSVSTGDDCAWIDYIVLPGAAGGAPLFADFLADNQDVCEGEAVNFTSSSVGNVTEYSWTFEGGDPATSDEEAPMVVYSTAGTYGVTLTISDGTSENTMTKDDFIIVNNCTGLNEAETFSLSIYPNPNNGIFTLKLNQNAKVEIISALGHVVYSDEFIGKQTIDLATQAEGIYFIKVETENDSIVKKIVVRK